MHLAGLYAGEMVVVIHNTNSVFLQKKKKAKQQFTGFPMTAVNYTSARQEDPCRIELKSMIEKSD